MTSAGSSPLSPATHLFYRKLNFLVFSRARHERFRESDMFRRVFERVVEACIAAGLVGGEGFAVDASLIAADANKQRSVPGSEWKKTRDPNGASRAMKEYLPSLDDAALGAGKRGSAEVCLAVRSSRAMDRCDARASVLRLMRTIISSTSSSGSSWMSRPPALFARRKSVQQRQ